MTGCIIGHGIGCTSIVLLSRLAPAIELSDADSFAVGLHAVMNISSAVLADDMYCQKNITAMLVEHCTAS
jgi:hypothetical protein